jgi:deoxyhypusine synthase
VAGLVDSLPGILAAEDLRAVAKAIAQAKSARRASIWGLGGHVVKCGLGPVLIDLMHEGYISAFAMNGSTAIHDFELAIAGQTSEEVEAVLPDGSFGSAEETGREMNEALKNLPDGVGAGQALGKRLEGLADQRYSDCSILLQAYRAAVPVTVHSAIGTDTTHVHPQIDPAALGRATHTDFRLLASLMKELDRGGVYCNLGSAVVLPEVFLKALTLIRNLGFDAREFTTVNFDFLQHYRPRANVVNRPHAESGGRGYALTGHHEIMIPLLAAILKDQVFDERS